MVGLGVPELAILLTVCAWVLGPLLVAVIIYFVMKKREKSGSEKS